MTITLDSWQPILVAIIGVIGALLVPVVSAILSSRNAKRALETATLAADTAASTATEIGDKVDRVAAKLDKHADAVAEIGVKINGERTELMQKIAQQEQEIIQMRRRASEHPDAR